MVRECFKTNTGIMFEAASLKEIGLDPATLYPFVLPRPPPCCVKQMEHQVRRRPTNPIPVRLHAALKNKRHAEVHARHVISPAQFLGSEEKEELHDALSPAYDQLKLQRFWWLGEIIPLSLKYQRGNNEWVTRFGCVNQMWYSFRWDIQTSGWSDVILRNPGLSLSKFNTGSRFIGVLNCAWMQNTRTRRRKVRSIDQRQISVSSLRGSISLLFFLNPTLSISNDPYTYYTFHLYLIMESKCYSTML